MGQAAAVGIAQHQKIGTGIEGSCKGFQGIVRDVLETVEEVLGIIDHVPAAGLEKGDAVANHGQVLLQGVVHDGLDMQAPALAEDGGRRRIAIQNRLEVGIVGGIDAGFAGGPKGGDAGGRELFPLG